MMTFIYPCLPNYFFSLVVLVLPFATLPYFNGLLTQAAAVATTMASDYCTPATPSYSNACPFKIHQPTLTTLLKPFSNKFVEDGVTWNGVNALNRLREELLFAGYTISGVQSVLQSTLVSDDQQKQKISIYNPVLYLNLWQRDTRIQENLNNLQSPLGILVKLFYLGQYVYYDDIQRVYNHSISNTNNKFLFLSAATFNTLSSLGLWFFDPQSTRQRIRLPVMFHPVASVGSPISPLLIVSDHAWYSMNDDGYSGIDRVYYLGIDSYALLEAAPRPPKNSHILDTCTGSGVQGIAASGYCAVAGGGCVLVLNDINPRAIRFARFNLAMNLHALPGLVQPTMTNPMATSIGTWLKNSVVEGDVTALIQHEVYRFDLILANPPYLPDPKETSALFGRGGGNLGDQAILRIVQAAAGNTTCDGLLRHVPGATLAIVGNVANINTLSHRLARAWYNNHHQHNDTCKLDGIDTEKNDCIFALHAHGLVQSVEHYSRMRNIEGYDITGDAFRANGITDMSSHSFLFLQRMETNNNGSGETRTCSVRKWEYHDLNLEGALWDRISGITGRTEQNIARTNIYTHLK
jgi:hypothetical protein